MTVEFLFGMKKDKAVDGIKTWSCPALTMPDQVAGTSGIITIAATTVLFVHSAY